MDTLDTKIKGKDFTAANIQELKEYIRDIHRRLELLRGYL